MPQLTTAINFPVRKLFYALPQIPFAVMWFCVVFFSLFTLSHGLSIAANSLVAYGSCVVISRFILIHLCNRRISTVMCKKFVVDLYVFRSINSADTHMLTHRRSLSVTWWHKLLIFGDLMHSVVSAEQRWMMVLCVMRVLSLWYRYNVKY